MKIRKNGVWEDYKYPIYESATDTITSLPTDIIADGQPVAAWTISGNMQQTGTPSPTTPIQPQECGERTGNMFDGEYPNIDSIVRYRALNLGNGTYTLSSTVEISPSSAGTLFFLAGNVSSGASTATNAVYKDRPITVTSTDGYVTIAYRTYTTDTPVGKETMLNSGSTALPYEPYGFKIPISSANTTTPVYLGEVETMRKIRELVLTGEENWQLHSSQANLFTLSTVVDYLYNSSLSSICSHYTTKVVASAASAAADNNTLSFYFNSNSPSVRVIYIKDMTYSTAADFKTYLQQQYAAGTPVTVWYVLAEPTTGILNEPLRKIGDYADTISNVAEIPTTAGSQTFDVQTSLKPSSVEITYKGWHKHTPKEYDNGSWS